jgi:Ca2+-transporting ATPase
MDEIKTNWHTLSVAETAAKLQTDAARGLNPVEARTRLEKTGQNRLAEEKKFSFWKEFIEELREPMVLMLLATGVLYGIWGEIGEAIVIFCIILALNTVEVVNEMRSKKAIAGLQKMAEPTAAVFRDGLYQEVPAEEIVPGDLVVLLPGHRIPADARLVHSGGLQVDESALTGESVPVDKVSEILLKATCPLAERTNMVYASTLVRRGSGTALVTATGMDMEVGRVMDLTRQVREPRTPLQNIMTELSKTLVWFALGFSLLVPLVGILIAHQPPKEMLLVGLSLMFATIPEELPIIITMVLALGASRLSKRGAIAKHLKAVESLGSVTVIATDKTGTLTENRLRVTHIEPAENESRLLELGVLCNDAIIDEGEITGDPVDNALLHAATDLNLGPRELKKNWQVILSLPFDSQRKQQVVVVDDSESRKVVVKGAPEALLNQCTGVWQSGQREPLDPSHQESLLQLVDALAAKGVKVLGLAERDLPGEAALDKRVAEALTFVGLVGLADLPRPEAQGAIAACRDAGIRTVMITGDHPQTAQAVARAVGLPNSDEVVSGLQLDQVSDLELQSLVRKINVFARTTPEHKLRLVRAFQANGERVAVTGDGVNDAPALAAADIGVAMALNGTDVAREASDLLLTDDNFTTIVHAVSEGRLIFENLKKGVRYYLSCKLALVLITLLPTLLLVPVPFTPVQIILMELFMDLMAAAAFVAEPAESDLLKQPPRDPKARFMDRKMVGSLLMASLSLFGAVSILYLGVWYSTYDVTTAQTVAFYAWLMGHVFLAFNLRSVRQPMFEVGLGQNRLMFIWGGAVAGFLLLVNLIPGLQNIMGITALKGVQWAWILGVTLVGTFWLEIKKIVGFHAEKGKRAND